MVRKYRHTMLAVFSLDHQNRPYIPILFLLEPLRFVLSVSGSISDYPEGGLVDHTEQMEFSGVRTLGRLCRFLILVGCCLLDSTYSFNPHPRFPSPSLFHSLSAMKLKSGRRPLSMELTTHHYMQTLDHFTFKEEGYRRFPQRYLVNNSYWRGPQSNSPIFVGLGRRVWHHIPVNRLWHNHWTCCPFQSAHPLHRGTYFSYTYIFHSIIPYRYY